MRQVLPFSDLSVRHVDVVRKVEEPFYSGKNFQVNAREYALQVDGFGSFYVCNGTEVEYSVIPTADEGWVQLYLNTQVLVALMHQRGMINFHASSFIYNGKGIMILGETGAGKSSLTASFVIEGARLLSDDLTPVILRKTGPFIFPLNRHIKLCEDAAWQLDIKNELLSEAEKGTGKFYLNAGHISHSEYQLNTIFMIEKGDASTPEFCTPELAEKFSIMRSEICSWEMLAGMPRTEALYLEQVLQIVHQVKIVRVLRPEVIRIPVLHAAVIDYLEING